MIFLVSSLILSFTAAFAATPAEILKPYGISVSGFEVAGHSEQSAGDRKILNLKLKNEDGEADLQLTGPLDKGQYENYLKMETIAFKHLYQPAITPYPGKISNEKSCPKDLLPRNERRPLLGQTVEVSFTKAGARKTFGVCTKADAVFDAALAYIHLPNGYALKFAAFTPPGRGGKEFFSRLSKPFSLE